jgi:membrane protein implicated in regulation of membrane protease activity
VCLQFVIELSVFMCVCAGCVFGTPVPWLFLCVCVFVCTLVFSFVLLYALVLSSPVYSRKKKKKAYISFTIGRNFSGNQHGTVISL